MNQERKYVIDGGGSDLFFYDLLPLSKFLILIKKENHFYWFGLVAAEPS